MVKTFKNGKVRFLSIMIILSMIFLPSHQSIARGLEDEPLRGGDIFADEVVAPFRGMRELVLGLLEVNVDPTDSDDDGLPDAVEWVIDTDPFNSDSDFDRLNDTFEVMNNMDPMKPDSNRDGLPDYFEVNNITIDIDGDGVENPWDTDNDGDGLSDSIDISPFYTTPSNSTFHFNIRSSGNPLYLELQIQPRDPEHLRFIGQTYDWPRDDQGTMRDLDESKDDVMSTPIMRMSTDLEILQEKVNEYGMSIGEAEAYVPLFPVRENGRIVAFSGKMFIPSSPIDEEVELDLDLLWKITGYSDCPSRTISWSSGKLITKDLSGSILIKDTSTTEEQAWLLSDMGKDRVAFKNRNGMYLSVDGEGVLTCTGTDLEDEGIFELCSKSGTKAALKAEDGGYLVAQPDGSIRSVSGVNPADNRWTLTDLGYFREPVTLAVYEEDFKITGFTVEESFGSEIGLFYGDDAAEMTAANLALAYDFLRNSSNNLTDMPSILDNYEISHSYDIRSFPHKDIGTKVAATEMKAAALETFPESIRLPLITVGEDHFSMVEMRDLFNESVAPAMDFKVDLTKVPVLTTRFLKTCWYEMPDDSAIEDEEILLDISDMDIPNSAKKTLVCMSISWMAGEQTVISEGPDVKEFSFPEENDIGPTIISVLDYGIAGFSTIHEAVLITKAAYQFYQLAKFDKGVKFFAKGGYKLFAGFHESISGVQSGKWGAWNKMGKALLVVEIALAVGISIYALVAIGNAMDWSGVGTAIAVVYSVMLLAYSLVLIGIGMLGPVGFILALLIALSDLIVGWICGTGWFQMFLEWFIGLFTDFNERTTVDLTMHGSNVTIDDKENNGLTAGDNITYIAEATGRINKTSDGTYGDLVDSYIKPHFNVSVPGSSKSKTGSIFIGHTPNIQSTYKETDYDTGFWVEPGIGMVNFPVTYWLSTEYKVYYEECWWLFKWWCDRKSQENWQEGTKTTMYFDVMPKSIDEFGTWKGITPLDADGDGLNNSDETDTHPWKWDTDGDGLGDKYEMDYGTDPTLSDTDGDGIFDRTEHDWLMDYSLEDTDDDGISDYMEHEGWIVTFEFCGTEFDWHINSDPRLNDTDGDGLNDRIEYLCKLNPRSKDTDGDGRLDVIRDYYETYIEHDTTYNNYVLSSRIEVMSNGSVIHIDNYGGLPIEIYDRNGSFQGSLELPDSSRPIDAAMDSEGKIYVISSDFPTPYNCYIHVYNADWTYNQTFHDNALYDIETMVIDDDDIMYIQHRGDGGFPKYLTKAYASNYTIISRWIDEISDGVGKVGVDRFGNIYVLCHDIMVFYPNGTLNYTWETSGSGEGQFDDPVDISFDDEGCIYVLERGNKRVQKFDPDRRFIKEFGTHISGDLNYYEESIGISSDLSIYVYGSDHDGGAGRVRRFNQTIEFHPANETTGFTDTDGDGLTDTQEETGWVVNITTPSGQFEYNVSSDPKLKDSDDDSLTDREEFNLTSDPNSCDTDGDGLSDPDEVEYGTNITRWDTDGDGLGDAEELLFLSDPLVPDSDGDGLFDLQEFNIGSNPNDHDTDDDGLPDKEEVDFGSDPLNPDEDGDSMFDSMEITVGTHPNDPDDDGDGLIDGYELYYQTDPLSEDSDGDRVKDGFEVAANLDPNSNDTDGDGLEDGREIEIGYNPLSQDSDGDGIKDGDDLDFQIDLGEDVILAYDSLSNAEGFVEKLSTGVGVDVVTPEQLISEYNGSRYIVLIGHPTMVEGTAGRVISDLLSDMGDVLELMSTSADDRCQVRYGVWNSTQTIVMLSSLYPGDANRVLGILKSMKMTVESGKVTVEYLNPRGCFMLDSMTSTLATDTSAFCKFDHELTFNVEMSTSDDPSPMLPLSDLNGAGEDEVDMGKYVSFGIFDRAGQAIEDNIEGGEFKVYYTDLDLDMTGDGDGDDDDDLDESTLSLFRYDEMNSLWIRVTDDLPWVNATGVDTNDVILFGREYAGYIWANVTRFSTFGIAGLPNVYIPYVPPPPVAFAGHDLTIYAGSTVDLDGAQSAGEAGLVNFTWIISTDEEDFFLYGPLGQYQFNDPGEYEVTLTVRDSLDREASHTIHISVIELPPTEFILTVGPVLNAGGEPVEGAKIELTVNGTKHTNTTDDEGYSEFVLTIDLKGMEITISIEAEGYETVTFDTRINEDGELEGSMPKLEKVEYQEEEDYSTLIALIILFSAAIIIAIAIFTTRKDKDIEELEE